MKHFLKLVVVAVIILIGVVLAGIYRFNFTYSDLFVEMEDGRILPLDEAKALENVAKQTSRQNILAPDPVVTPSNENSQSGSQNVMLKLFSLQTENPFAVTLPDGQQSVPLTHFVGQSDTEFAAGDFLYGEERGTVLLDYFNITPLTFLNDDDENAGKKERNFNDQAMPFVVPFVVTNQGSGAFWYLGLFHINYHNNTLSHFDSVFIGDRVNIEAVEPATPFEPPYHVNVLYRDREMTQAMTDTPAIDKVLTVNVSEQGLSVDR